MTATTTKIYYSSTTTTTKAAFPSMMLTTGTGTIKMFAKNWFLLLFLLLLLGGKNSNDGRNSGCSISIVDGFLLHSALLTPRSITITTTTTTTPKNYYYYYHPDINGHSSSSKKVEIVLLSKARIMGSDDNNDNDEDEDNNDDGSIIIVDEMEYQRKLDEAKVAIEEAKKARDENYYNKNNNISSSSSSFLKADEISTLLDEAAKAKKKKSQEESKRRKLQRTASSSSSFIIEKEESKAASSTNNNNNNMKKKKKKKDNIPIRSRIEYTDAGTLNIIIPSRGTTTNSLFAGAFSAAWFSAIIPATISTGGAAGLLFMVPFWAAGGLVAKQAIVDPYVSYSLSIGQYAWSLQQTYFKKSKSKSKPSTNKGLVLGNKKVRQGQVEGSTNQLYNANVELAIIVNDIPQYEIRLLYNNKDTSGDSGMTTEVVSFGLGLPQEELEYLVEEINKHIDNIQNFPDESQLPSSKL